MLRKAAFEDLDQIEILMGRVVPLMLAQNNPQWNEEYPARKDFQKDIEEDTLYVWEQDGKVLGVVCVNFEEPEGYRTAQWSVDKKPTIIHRMAVEPESRGLGIGTAMFSLAERIARENGTFYIKTDTYGTNAEMNGLMQKMGYHMTGHCRFDGRDGDFNCYEKVLESPAT